MITTTRFTPNYGFIRPSFKQTTTYEREFNVEEAYNLLEKGFNKQGNADEKRKWLKRQLNKLKKASDSDEKFEAKLKDLSKFGADRLHFANTDKIDRSVFDLNISLCLFYLVFAGEKFGIGDPKLNFVRGVFGIIRSNVGKAIPFKPGYPENMSDPCFGLLSSWAGTQSQTIKDRLLQGGFTRHGLKRYSLN